MQTPIAGAGLFLMVLSAVAYAWRDEYAPVRLEVASPTLFVGLLLYSVILIERNLHRQLPWLPRFIAFWTVFFCLLRPVFLEYLMPHRRDGLRVTPGISRSQTEVAMRRHLTGLQS